MSELRVEIVTIKEVENHPNADRLDVCHVEGWTCVTQKDAFKAGQVALYIPIDSVLPEKLEEFIFPPDSKIKLSGHRVRTIKLRGAVSQGLLLHIQPLIDNGFITNKAFPLHVNKDYAKILGITKYEPPLKISPQSNLKQVKKRFKHPEFSEYTKIENFKWYPDLFTLGDQVVVMEKIHGSNIRVGLVPFYENTLWKKIKSFFNLNPSHEFVYGSHHVQLQYKKSYNGFYDKNIYMEMVRKYDLENKLLPGEVAYGEVYGAGVQKNYWYGCKENERKLVIFDVKKDGKYQDFSYVIKFCERVGVPHAPIEFIGTYEGKDQLKQWVEGKSSLHPEQKVREGIVIKPLVENHCYMGRKILKYKSDHFLLTQEDDTH